MLTDTHCHINCMIKDTFDVSLPSNFKEKTELILEAAQARGVTTIINVGTSLQESLNCIALAQNFKNIFATIGIHPNDITSNWQDELKIFTTLLQDQKNKIVGIGEIGLDYHYPNYDKKLQSTALEAQIELAVSSKKAIVIHTRDAGQDVLDIIESYKNYLVRGIIHCFSEDLAFAKRALDLGFVIGIGGAVTYPKNEILRTVVKSIPLSAIVLETDAPFLPPQYMRGKQNNPAQIEVIARYIAELKGITFEFVAESTTATAFNLFQLL